MAIDNIRVVLFDDNKRICDALSMLLGATPGITFVASFNDCNSLETDLINTNPNVILMDIDMPGIDGVEATRIIRMTNPSIRVLMQTVFDDSDRIFAAICAGAHGYILKNTPPARIIEYIHDVFHGGAPMTAEVASKVLRLLAGTNQHIRSEDPYRISPREREVLKLLVDGKSYKMIGAQLDITYDTVRAHIKKIYEKLHVSSMTEAVAKAIKDRIV